MPELPDISWAKNRENKVAVLLFAKNRENKVAVLLFAVGSITSRVLGATDLAVFNSDADLDLDQEQRAA